MDIISVVIVFILSWWIVFFMTLPWGIEMEGVNEAGNLPGAPKIHNLKKKALITTAIAIFVTAIISTMIIYNVIDFRGIANTMFEEDIKS